MQLCVALQRQGLKPDIVTHAALISACEKGQDLSKALHLCVALQRQGLKPDIVTYSALINACGKGQDLASALQLMDIELDNQSVPVLSTLLNNTIPS